ncbi:DUF721 domain-containing protein [Bartonella sp. B41]
MIRKKKQYKRCDFLSLSEMTAEILDPILRRRMGLSVELIEHWSQIVGSDICECTTPLKIIWRRRIDQDEVFHPATLVIACERGISLKLMHKTGELLHRINVFFGYAAIDRIKIEQRYISVFTDDLLEKFVPNEKDKKHVKKMLKEIDDERLHRSLYELGCCIFAEKNNR